ncbi:hypothetical protein A2110_01775 [Candidatus Jorgensenbacteria bacterium GWA1_54_12]|uniref:HTH luxR-type domain-containing protein n=1 Tax=Candidatus Jorgensenbacteria bacterium GWA1_54_12 TaxID=1798468 RepID=A0A1F6BLP7_9BACT|nr:MAG: hypothetical protein A2110_01775 [Candidatus Jorgensenbacteria bacterium GWA1_54_12]
MIPESEKKILDALEKILKVLSLQIAPGKGLTEKAVLLKTVGLDNKTIAEVLNTSPATIRTLTTNFREKAKKLI